MNIYGPPTLGPALFGAVLGAAKSPVLAERKAGDFYALIASYGIDPAFGLSIFAHESTYGTNAKAVVNRYGTRNWSNTRSQRKPGLGATIVQTDRGNFAKYPTWYASLDDLCYRLSDPAYAYQQKGARTVETVVPIMAPPGDFDNDPLAYVRGVVAQMTAWQAQDKAGGTKVVTKPTINSSQQSPNRNGYGGTRRVEAIVWHVTAGGFSGSIGWLCNPDAGASANYLLNKDGTPYELVPPDQDAWANGQVDHPDTSNPAIARWLREGVNFNQRTVSIEIVRETSANNQPGGFTPAQRDSLIALTAWLCERFNVTPDRTHILRHAQIDSVNRPYCPGLAESEMQSWVGQIAALVNGGAVASPGGTIGAALKDTPQPARPPGYLEVGQADTFLWPEGAGIITDRTVVYFNPDEQAFYRREWHNDTGYTPWEKVG